MISKLRDARNAALITHASGEQQDELGERMGLPRPHFISREAWGKAMLAANGYRGTPQCLQFFLEGALSDWHIKRKVVIDPSWASQLVSPDAAFTQDLVGRTVRLPDHGIFRVVGPYDVNQAPFRNEILDLCTTSTPSWDVPAWEALENPLEVDAEFHCFLVWEDQAGPPSQANGDETGTVTVYVYPEVLTEAPPTFLLPLPDGLPTYEEEHPSDTPSEVLDPQPPDDWPEGVPSGGWLVEPDSDLIVGPPDGPWPAFVAGIEVLEPLKVAMCAILDAGFKVRFEPLPQWVAQV